jgi:DNA polymerase III epsilon subunit-like protein
MGLADLKKNASLCKNTTNIAVSIDDFIAAADLYAAGQDRHQHEAKQTITTTNADNQSNIIDFLQRKYPQYLEPMVSANKSKKQPYKHCTFTLSETAINELTLLSQQGVIAKSKLIRQLISQHFSLSPQQQKMLEANFSDQ